MNKNITQSDVKIWCNEAISLGREKFYLHAPYTGIDFISKIGVSPYGFKATKKTIKNDLYETIKSHINENDIIVDMTHGDKISWITIKQEEKKERLNWTKTFKSISLEK